MPRKPRKRKTPLPPSKKAALTKRALSEGRDPAKSHAVARGWVTRKRNKRAAAQLRGIERREVAGKTRRRLRLDGGEPAPYQPQPLDSGGMLLYAAPLDAAGRIDPDAAFAVLSDFHGSLLGSTDNARNTRGEKVGPIRLQRTFADLPPGKYTLAAQLQSRDLSVFADDDDVDLEDDLDEDDAYDARTISRYTQRAHVELSGDVHNRARQLLDELAAMLRTFTAAAYERDGAKTSRTAILVEEVWLYPR